MTYHVLMRFSLQEVVTKVLYDAWSYHSELPDEEPIATQVQGFGQRNLAMAAGGYPVCAQCTQLHWSCGMHSVILCVWN